MPFAKKAFFVVLVALAALVSAAPFRPAPALPSTAAPAASLSISSKPSTIASASAAPLVAPPPTPPETLQAYVARAMDSWRQITPMPRVESKLVAADIVAAVKDIGPAWTDDTSGARSAILLASIAWFESNYAEYVDDGSCNRWMSQAIEAGSFEEPDLSVLPKKAQDTLRYGNCDKGLAFSLWQIHDGGLYETDGKFYWFPAKWLRHRGFAAKAALRIARRSIGAGVGLCWYSGERGDCPKARHRLEFAERYSAAHPFGG